MEGGVPMELLQTKEKKKKEGEAARWDQHLGHGPPPAPPRLWLWLNQIQEIHMLLVQ